MEHRSEPERLAPGRAGARATGESQKFDAGEARGKKRQRKRSGPLWVSWRLNVWLYYGLIKIETPEASVSGVFNLELLIRIRI